ncbi:hypothetical protein KXV22_000076 [Aspergillus fumigatus]|nr:hypothetical protein CNMCM8686_001703 [Aspergillus fumigatus]KAH1362925.1 hypothetical protein KXX14_007579 [Aspergillus fumigatus]KAH1467445.1 hypothetical protein KXX58_004144 [Aspergillus fumigatus]KAH1522104.1 hypothetical protein KXX06_005904 [Aspergillus fumigatus]KAH1671304.1 hypothetical protein KXX65_007411 [Aspergillus fumigatus]
MQFSLLNFVALLAATSVNATVYLGLRTNYDGHKSQVAWTPKSGQTELQNPAAVSAPLSTVTATPVDETSMSTVTMGLSASKAAVEMG